MIPLDLFWRFVVVGLTAFGSGSAALPLVERTAVAAMGLTPQDFAVALAFAYVTPGPILITATAIGYRAAGVPGAITATVGVFIGPWFLATAASDQVRRFASSRWLRAFGRGATPAVVGLLGVTALALGRSILTGERAWLYGVIAAGAAAASLSRRIHPIGVVMGGAVAGLLIGQLA